MRVLGYRSTVAEFSFLLAFNAASTVNQPRRFEARGFPRFQGFSFYFPAFKFQCSC
jgi:hypothetical protein